MAKLASQRAVSKIYCLVRASDRRVARKRVLQSLRDRLVLHTLSAASQLKIVAIPSDLSDEHLGLATEEYAEISKNLTHVLHFAWSVNFNKTLESFEKDCIAGAKNLMTLCLRAQRPKSATFSFCSSVSTTVRTPDTAVPESLPQSLACAQGMGYAQSKLVTEHLCDRASQHGLHARVLRVGQIIGDSQHGVWNNSEAIPMIFQTAKTISALPKLDESPLWLPVDLVADSCIEISSSAAPSGVYNIVNHNSFHWTRDLLPLLRSAGLEFDELDQREWIQRLKASNPDPVSNPPIKLIDFFANKYDNEKPRRSLRYDNSISQDYSPSLQNAGLVDAALMQKIVSQLSRNWSISNTRQEPTAIFLCGPCGSGKTSAAQAMSSKYSVPIIEGDDIHSLSAKAAMRNGTALTDAERLVWLSHIRGAVVDRFASSQSPAVLVTCSALKTSYRDELRKLHDIANIHTVFIMLSTTDGDDLRQRLSLRKDHYMGSSMVASQLDILEAPRDHEIDTVIVDANQGMIDMLTDVEDVIDIILS